MIVKSASNKSPARLDEVLIAIIDSTRHPHANDSRARGTAGLGAGTIGLIMNSTGNAVAFTWRGGESTKEEMTEISFGRIGDKMEHSTARHATTSETIGMTTIIDQVVVATAAITLTITALIVRTRLGKEKSYVNASTNRAK